MLSTTARFVERGDCFLHYWFYASHAIFEPTIRIPRQCVTSKLYQPIGVSFFIRQLQLKKVTISPLTSLCAKTITLLSMLFFLFAIISASTLHITAGCCYTKHLQTVRLSKKKTKF